ncbi:MAG: spore germination protein [Oscillospiraceae bacterium]|nr:spore germination protein [Oscillospiraceae bacterium]
MPKLTGSVHRDCALLKSIFHAPQNADFIVRTVSPHGVEMAVLYVDGMANRSGIEDMILRPLMNMRPFGTTPPGQRSAVLLQRVLPTGTGQLSSDTDALVPFLLAGNVVVLCDGSENAVMAEMPGFATRGVSQPLTENAAFAPHEAFNESIRVNLTLLHRALHTPDLVTEFFTIGETSRTKAALVYLQNVADEVLVSEARRRLNGVKVDKLLSIGQLQQLIEDDAHRILPQMLQTERPDRAASFLTDGMVVIVCDNAPYVLSAPATFLTFLHTPDDHALRWQYGTFIRFNRTLGFCISLILPALYNALLLYHEDLLPADLMTSILEGYTLVPLSVTLELILMNFIFDLINEASLRMPGSMGSTLGIVGGLVLGQAAVSANLISPVLIIVVSVAGLGLFAVPSYPLSLAVRIVRLLLIAASTVAGFAGIALGMTALICSLTGMESFGTPCFAPLAPSMRKNGDGLFTRLDVRRQQRRAGMARPQHEPELQDPRAWDRNGGNA